MTAQTVEFGAQVVTFYAEDVPLEDRMPADRRKGDKEFLASLVTVAVDERQAVLA